MDNSKKRGWLWCGLIGVALIIAIWLWPHKPQKVVAVEILNDSIVDTTTLIQKTYTPYQPKKKIETKHTEQPTIDYTKLYQHPKEQPSKYDNFKVKINEADTNDWKELKGIGSAYAKRIVNYRKSLGGYRSIEQIKEVYGMTDELYNLIAPHLILDIENIVKIDINTAPLDQLKRHPYIDYYQAKAIVKYRENIGNFTSIDEVLNIPLIDTATFNKIRIYITI